MMNEMNILDDVKVVELNDEEVEAVAGGTKVKATGNVNVRKGPSKDYGILGTVQKGETLTYCNDSQRDKRGVRWYKVKYNGSTGWVSSKYSKLK